MKASITKMVYYSHCIYTTKLKNSTYYGTRAKQLSTVFDKTEPK
jgi:hypothetical protein